RRAARLHGSTESPGQPQDRVLNPAGPAREAEADFLAFPRNLARRERSFRETALTSAKDRSDGGEVCEGAVGGVDRSGRNETSGRTGRSRAGVFRDCAGARGSAPTLTGATEKCRRVRMPSVARGKVDEREVTQAVLSERPWGAGTGGPAGGESGG